MNINLEIKQIRYLIANIKIKNLIIRKSVKKLLENTLMIYKLWREFCNRLRQKNEQVEMNKNLKKDGKNAFFKLNPSYKSSIPVGK